MRSKKYEVRCPTGFRQFFVFCILSISSLAFGQSTPDQNNTERPGVILLRISPVVIPALREQFQFVRPASDPKFQHTDINSAGLSGDSVIRVALGLAGLHGLKLHPYIPTHSIAFEDIRERSNPQLFSKPVAIKGDNDNTNDLRIAEEKLSRWFVLSYSDSLQPGAAALVAKKSALIELVEPLYIRHTCYTPNDPLVPSQYALPMIHAFEAWDIVRCDNTMIVADVDVGTDWTHEDLTNAIYNNPGEIGVDSNGIDKRANGVDDDGNGFIDDWHGWDFDGPAGDTPSNNPNTPQSHGTHTAGIIAAVGDNNIGVAGVAFGARLLPIKVSNNAGQSLDFGFQGITYAADMHAKAVNCSWGGPTRSNAEQEVIDYAYAKDCVVVAAAGNNGIFQDFYPAAYNHVLGVAAVQSAGQIDSYSNFNTHVSVSAPGTAVLSTVPLNQYQALTGTSMASPNACGSIALVRQRFPSMTAGQAMQQLRATSTPVSVDSARADLVGRGLVNVFRAVTDTNAHSARIENYAISNTNGSGSLASGESGGIILNIRNFLKPVNNLKANIAVVQGSDAIVLHNTSLSFGPVQTMQVVQNQATAFQVTVSDTVSPNTLVLLKVTFFDSTVGYTSDVDYFSFIINPSYLDLNQNNITATFASKGSIGYNDVVTNAQGSGFVWSKAPPSILPISISVLFQGGIMIGTDQQHLVDVLQNESSYGADEDLKATKIIHNVIPPDHANAVQELACQYSDSLADPSIQVGVKVDQQAYAFNQGLSANAVVMRYVLRKNPTVSGWQPTDSTAAGLFMDWDIGLSGALDNAYYDAETATAITKRIEPGYPYVGMKIISPLPTGAAVQYHAARNDGTEGDINTYDGFSKSEKWLALSEFHGNAGPSDISHSYGLKFLPLHSQDSVEIVMVIALAENTTLLTQTIDAATQAWNGIAAVSTSSLPDQNSIEVFPNPFRNTFTATWQTANSNTSPAHITIYDALGRSVLSENTVGNRYDFSSLNLPAGMYVVDVLVGEEHLTKQIISVH